MEKIKAVILIIISTFGINVSANETKMSSENVKLENTKENMEREIFEKMIKAGEIESGKIKKDGECIGGGGMG